MCRVLILTRSFPTKELFDIVNNVASKYGVHIDLVYLNSYEPNEVKKELATLQRPDLALLSLMGDKPELLSILDEWLSDSVVFTLSTGAETVLLTRVDGVELGRYLEGYVGKSDNYYDPKHLSQLLKLIAHSLQGDVKRHLENWALMIDYWRNWREDNVRNLLLFVLKEYCRLNVTNVKPPVELGDYRIEDPDGNIYRDSEEFASRYSKDLPRAIVLAYSGQSYEKSRSIIRALFKNGKVLTIPLFSNYGYTLKGISELIKNADLMLDIQWFRLVRRPEDSLVLSKLNVPVLGPVVMYGRELKNWEESSVGLSPIELIYAVAMPEVDGVVEPVVLGGLVDEGGVKVMRAVEDRVERVINRASNWAKLRRKPNSEKRIAVVIYNYPPGEENIGRAASLDTLKSLEVLLNRLRNAGYRVNPINYEELKEVFTKKLVNSGRWVDVKTVVDNGVGINTDSYLELFNELPEKLRNAVIKQWGEPPGSVMVYGDKIVLPVLDLGNVIVMLQPTRGWHEDPSKIYHDSELYPHHQYVAAYRWIEEVWQADAIIHLGTHGTLEFLPGKQVGLSSSCPPDALLGNVPNVYVYHVVVVGEGTIAKRRSYATLVSYLSPRITNAGLNGELKVLKELIDEYEEAKITDPPRANNVLQRIREVAVKYGLNADDLDKLHDELIRMERSAMPYGLRVLGNKLSDDEVVDYLSLALRRDRGLIKSLHRFLLNAMGYDYDEVLEHPGKYRELLNRVDDIVKEVVTALIKNGLEDALVLLEKYSIKRDEVRGILDYAINVASRLRESTSLEIENIVRALNGEYIPAGVGGDYVLDPDVLPAGRNFYALDPNKIPSEAALELGAKIAEESIKKFYEANGRYPESVGVVVWGGQEARTRGVTIGQVLRYLGVKLIHKPGSWDPRLEVIPLRELGRPRIDVVVTASGVFRDMFPHLMVLINNAVRMVAMLDEPVEMNYIRKHYLELSRDYGETALIRVFSERPGDYGVKVDKLIETSNWRDGRDIANVFTMYIGFGYHGSMNDVSSKDLRNLLTKLLSSVEITSQVQSSIDYSIVDIDDYYQYLGGLSKAVEVYSGRRPMILYTDLTQERPRMMDAKEAVGFYVRTRLLNPKWIEGMMRHGYMGAQNISKRVEYILGLAATTNAVEDWVWDRIADTYVFNEEVRRWLTENNPYALEQIIRRLYEAYKRGLWKAGEETIEKIRRLFSELESHLEGIR